MRTPLDLPDALVQEAMQVTHIKTKKKLVTLALEELIKRARRSDLKHRQQTYGLAGANHEETASNLTNLSKEAREPELDTQQLLRKEFEFLRTQNPFKDILDPVEWQREQRKDRELPR